MASSPEARAREVKAVQYTTGDPIKGVATLPALKDHINTHTGEKPYWYSSCPLCKQRQPLCARESVRYGLKGSEKNESRYLAC